MNLDLDTAQDLIARQSNDGPIPWDVILDYVIIQAKGANDKDAEIAQLKSELMRVKAESGLQKDFVKLTVRDTDTSICVDPLEITAIVGARKPLLILREESWEVDQDRQAILEAIGARVIEVKLCETK